MSKFIKSLAVFAASAPVINNKVAAAINTSINSCENLEPVSIRPLNYEYENMFAGHRSHSSHYSGSGYSGYSSSRTPVYSVPNYSNSSSSRSSTSTRNNSNITVKTYPNVPTRVDTHVNTYYGNNSNISNIATEEDPVLMQVMQIKRVQMALFQLGYYSGKIDGDLGKNTRKAIANYQVDKNLSINGRMTTELLNSLGISAVNYYE